VVVHSAISVSSSATVISGSEALLAGGQKGPLSRLKGCFGDVTTCFGRCVSMALPEPNYTSLIAAVEGYRKSRFRGKDLAESPELWNPAVDGIALWKTLERNNLLTHDCLICQQQDTTISNSTVLSCGHLFHTKCISATFFTVDIALKCPTCSMRSYRFMAPKDFDYSSLIAGNEIPDIVFSGCTGGDAISQYIQLDEHWAPIIPGENQEYPAVMWQWQTKFPIQSTEWTKTAKQESRVSPDVFNKTMGPIFAELLDAKLKYVDLVRDNKALRRYEGVDTNYNAATNVVHDSKWRDAQEAYLKSHPGGQFEFSPEEIAARINSPGGLNLEAKYYECLERAVAGFKKLNMPQTAKLFENARSKRVVWTRDTIYMPLQDDPEGWDYVCGRVQRNGQCYGRGLHPEYLYVEPCPLDANDRKDALTTSEDIAKGLRSRIAYGHSKGHNMTVPMARLQSAEQRVKDLRSGKISQ